MSEGRHELEARFYVRESSGPWSDRIYQPRGEPFRFDIALHRLVNARLRGREWPEGWTDDDPEAIAFHASGRVICAGEDIVRVDLADGGFVQLEYECLRPRLRLFVSMRDQDGRFTFFHFDPDERFRAFSHPAWVAAPYVMRAGPGTFRHLIIDERGDLTCTTETVFDGDCIRVPRLRAIHDLCGLSPYASHISDNLFAEPGEEGAILYPDRLIAHLAPVLYTPAMRDWMFGSPSGLGPRFR